MSDGLDYSLLAGPDGDVDGLLVEEFARGDDHTTVGLSGLLWTRADPRWAGASPFSRALRTSPTLSARVTPTGRDGAAVAYRCLGGGVLPPASHLRTRFLDHEPFATAAPLRLGPAHPPDGYRERRLYRVLFAKDLDPGGLAALTARLTVPSPRGPDDHFSWELRRVGSGSGRGIAWALDVTVLLSDGADSGVGPVLRALTDVVRLHGLIPVTTERFA